MEEENREGEKRIGRGMLYVGWILILALLVWVFSDFEESRLNPNRNLSASATTTNEVVLQKNIYGHYLFTGLANGKEVDFLLDTGASSVVFTEKQANELGLKKGFRMEVSTANGNISVYTTQLKTLRIGSIVLYDIEAAINPHMDGDALLGMSALGDLEWSQRGDQLTIRQ